jgi:hypothetical protein
MVCLNFTVTLLIYALLALDRPGRALFAIVVQFVLLILGALLSTVATSALGAIEYRLAAAYTVSSAIGVIVLWLLVKRDLPMTLLPRGVLRGLLPIVSVAAMIFAARTVTSSTFPGWVFVTLAATVVYALAVLAVGAASSRYAWLTG